MLSVYDSGISEGRILIFTTRSNFNMLQDTDDWFGDSIFKYAPLIFLIFPINTINLFTRGLVIPLVYITTTCLQETFVEALRQLLTLKSDMNQNKMIINENLSKNLFRAFKPNDTWIFFL